MRYRPEQSAINQDIVSHQLLLALRCDLTPGVFIRALGTQVTGEHRVLNMKKIEHILRQVLSPRHFSKLLRLFYTGSPDRIVANDKAANVTLYDTAGNHTSATANAPVIDICLNKDERNLHAIALPSFISKFMPHKHRSPLAVLIKDQKSPRVIFDASFHPNPDAIAINDIIDMEDSWHISYGQTFEFYVNWIWNVRISHPNEPIYQIADDVQGAFRHIVYHPDVVGAHSFTSDTSELLFLPTSSVFGATSSGCEYMIFADGRATTGENIADPRGAIPAEPRYDFEKNIPWKELPAPVPYGRANPDVLNTGVFTTDAYGFSRRKVTPHRPFVDDTCLADTKSFIADALHASLQSLFMFLGYPDEDRPGALATNKLEKTSFAEIQEQLGIVVDSRALTVALPTKKIEKLRHMTTTLWHVGRTTFTPLSAVTLLGLLRHASTIIWWAKYSFLELQGTVSRAIQAECYRARSRGEPGARYASIYKASLKQTLQSFNASYRSSSTNAATAWYRTARIRMTKALSEELKWLAHLLTEENNDVWTAPLAHLVPRTPNMTFETDASLRGLGGACISLLCLFRIELPYDIQQLTKLNTKTISPIVNINDLELAAAIIGFAAVKTLWLQGKLSFATAWPVLLLVIDNTSAIAYLNKGTTRSARSRSLLKIFACLAWKSPLSMGTEHIAGIDNVRADKLSRSFPIKSNDLSFLRSFVSQFKEMAGSVRFLPSSTLLSLIWQALRWGNLPGHPTKEMLKLHQNDASTIGSFAPLEV